MITIRSTPPPPPLDHHPECTRELYRCSSMVHVAPSFPCLASSTPLGYSMPEEQTHSSFCPLIATLFGSHHYWRWHLRGTG